MGDMIDRDDAIKVARSLFRLQTSGIYGAAGVNGYGLLTDTAERAIRNLPAAPAKDVRAGAQMADLSLPTLLKQSREDALREAIKAATGVSVFNPTASQGEINTAVMVLAKVEKAILALIPEAKP